MNTEGLCAENYRPHQKKNNYSGFVNSNNGDTVLLSEFMYLFKHLKKKLIIKKMKGQKTKNAE